MMHDKEIRELFNTVTGWFEDRNLVAEIDVTLSPEHHASIFPESKEAGAYDVEDHAIRPYRTGVSEKKLKTTFFFGGATVVRVYEKRK